MGDWLDLARDLDGGSTENGLARMADALRMEHPFLAIDRKGKLVGFASLAERNSNEAEFSWFAVEAQRQGNGTGSRLLADSY